ncbi:hypothetical protein BGP77_14155 [Saccharospirillum sp. MSK14-1]|uniref:TetR/AcrR family transcriptional regulator n=1 Tax=Saccharospirillum sp. MSK14-1 TaxID=1897632 RepID=UPI000D384A81|nr:TetR/AcrR family transcriptional regulator [Saccharospirillum sp. MSK14-1]PTY37628.1 hypothetical protein BGP77_14155 [Saccharospirillum sp. MSK14-1]
MTVTVKSEQTRQRILQTGRDLVLSGGFVGVGLKQILTDSGVPKGSFYYYFDSKEAFGCALLQDYVDEYLARLDTIVALPYSAADRLMRYLQPAQDASACIAERCLIVKLAAEISDLYESMRLILDAGVAGIVARLTQLLEAGQADGSLQSDHPHNDAASLYSQWLGAAVLTKLSQQPSFLQNAVADTQRRFVTH